MKTFIIEDEKRKHKVAGADELLQPLIKTHGCRRIYRYTNPCDKAPNSRLAGFITPGNSKEQEFLNSPLVHNPVLVYQEEESCPRCFGKTVTQHRGSDALLIALWLLPVLVCLFLKMELGLLSLSHSFMILIVPAIGYSIWHMKTGFPWCATCTKPVGTHHPTNHAAIISCLFALAFFIPLLSGVAAIITGLWGRHRACATGRGALLATAGLLLGVLSATGWILYFCLT